MPDLSTKEMCPVSAGGWGRLSPRRAREHGARRWIWSEQRTGAAGPQGHLEQLGVWRGWKQALPQVENVEAGGCGPKYSILYTFVYV